LLSKLVNLVAADAVNEFTDAVPALNEFTLTAVDAVNEFTDAVPALNEFILTC
jgi:hypothetical protein